MNANKLLLIALALCLCVSPALAVGKFYESKIVPYNMTEELASLPQNLYGTLQVHLRCSDNFLTPEIGIKNQIEPNGTFRFFPILPDGTFEMQLIPGRYDLFLKDGNGGQPEYSTALITAGMTSYPERELLGHAYAGSPEAIEPVPSCPMATGGSWNIRHPFRASFTLESTADPMWVQVETTVTGEKCTEWGWFFKCNEWTKTTETQTQWHLSQWSSHFNIITDVFRSPVIVTPTTIGCKPVTPCEHHEHTDLDITPQ